MKTTIRIIALLALAWTALPHLAIADDVAPTPMPRPQMDDSSAPSPGDTGTDAAPDPADVTPTGDNDSLMPTADTALEATNLGTTPEPVKLSARITEKGSQISDGLVWRVYSAQPDKNGQLQMVARSELPSPTVNLKPGDYVVHVAYGRCQSSDTLSVRNKAAAKTMILDVGGLKLDAAITGDVQIPFNLLHFDVFTAGASDADRALVAERVSANDILTLNAGTYHVISYFGEVNAIVRADLRVEPGRLTEATLYQKAAQVALKLVSQPGGDPIADVDWTVTNDTGQSVFTNTGTFPTTVLEEGAYTVSAKRGDKTYTQRFEVKAGPEEDIDVLTTAS